MNRRPNPEGYTNPTPSADSPETIATDELLSLMGDVLDALEDAGHPAFAAADRDPAMKDSATDSQRKAWLAVYGPLTDVLESR